MNFTSIPKESKIKHESNVNVRDKEIQQHNLRCISACQPRQLAKSYQFWQSRTRTICCRIHGQNDRTQVRLETI